MHRSALIWLILPLALAACSGGEVRNTLGLNAKAPDEFVVYSRPPLSVPPEFDLKPPRPGEESPFVATSEDEARQTLLGTKRAPSSLEELEESSVSTAVPAVLSADAPTQAQSSFLKKLGTDEADSSIREKLSQDLQEKPKKEKKARTLYDKIVGSETAEPVVDAKAEANRIRTNKDEGKPLTEGDTPTVDQKKKSVIDTLF